MISLISGQIAEFQLRKLKQEIFIKYEKEIKHWHRYIDNVFAILLKYADQGEILQKLNNLANKFTSVIEMNKTFQLLDLSII